MQSFLLKTFCIFALRRFIRRFCILIYGGAQHLRWRSRREIGIGLGAATYSLVWYGMAIA